MGLQGNIEAEKLLLGCILLNNSVMKELVIQPEHFSILHRDLFRAMMEISDRDEMINRATLFEKLGSNYMSQLNIGEMMGAVPSASGFKFHEELVLRYWKNVQVREKSVDFLQDTGNVVSEEKVTAFLAEMAKLDGIGFRRDEFHLGKTIGICMIKRYLVR